MGSSPDRTLLLRIAGSKESVSSNITALSSVFCHSFDLVHFAKNGRNTFEVNWTKCFGLENGRNENERFTVVDSRWLLNLKFGMFKIHDNVLEVKAKKACCMWNTISISQSTNHVTALWCCCPRICFKSQIRMCRSSNAVYQQTMNPLSHLFVVVSRYLVFFVFPKHKVFVTNKQWNS